MILIDFSQIMFSSIYADFNSIGAKKFNEDYFRHFAINSLRSYRTKHKKKYGELVICCDSRKYWRKENFKYYKAGRKKGREVSKLPWDDIFVWMDNLKSDLKENFPYRLIEVSGAEADDVIGFLCQRFGDKENILIVSSDKDFQQLQRYSKVDQYSPMAKKWLKCPNPINFLKEHVYRGDVGDGIPNVFSDDDTLVVEGKRQTPIRAKNLTEWMNQTPEEFYSGDDELKVRWFRNSELIDLTKVPDGVKLSILEEYTNTPVCKTSGKIFDYLVKHRMMVLLSSVHEF